MSHRCLPGGRGQDNDWPSLTTSWHATIAPSGVAATVAAAVVGYDDIKTVRYFGVELEEVLIKPFLFAPCRNG